MRDQGTAFRLPDDIGRIRRSKSGVDGHLNGTNTGNGKQQVDPFGTIVQPDANPVAPAHTSGDQATGDAVNLCSLFDKGFRLVLKHHRLGVTPTGGGQAG